MALEIFASEVIALLRPLVPTRYLGRGSFFTIWPCEVHMKTFAIFGGGYMEVLDDE